ncbi:MAG: pyridoxal phosphate-dependent aminotransferase [Candidatus Neomarinimicrobiota bacterium]|jgi:aspartate aminotransferase|nr:pyridoxal phosphate-dependent aminotransferase [Candidatus Neomarinimicrobiota bacterium]|tara:strand:- start:371 stop:1567 length:1197 start_codon:yes stop_codon:yes gene_type:complete
MKFADRVHKVKPSFTLEMTSRAAELKHAGHDVISFSAGQPDFNTPENIIEAAKVAMDDGYTKYTAGSGMIELRNAVCEKVKRENNINISPEEVLVSNGEKQSLYLACQALFQTGDEVIIFKPYWVSFPEFVTLSDATPILIDTDHSNNFEPDISDIIAAENKNVKGIIINSPSNPTGSVWSKKIILEILKLAKEKNWVVISDECYERLVFDGEHTVSKKLAIDNNIDANIVTCMSMSKTYAMTGWRIGYAFGDIDIINAMSKIQGQATSCANSIGQVASIEALVGDQSAVDQMIIVFKKRRDYMIKLLNDLPEVKCLVPGGAFYAFPDFGYYMGKSFDGKIIKDSFDLCEIFLNEAYVATIPGDGFGAPGYVRFSYAIDEKTIKEGIDRVKKIIQQIT